MNLYLLIPKKLKKHPGKMAGAIAHAIFRLPKRKYKKVVVLEYTQLPYLKDIVIIRDAGRTVVAPGTITCIAGYADEIKGKLL